MSVLDRYKKPGGFIQLLTLLETCGAAKKEKFLQMIYDESQDWFNALKTRILTIEIVISWPQEFLTELTTRTQPITLAAIAKGPFSSEQIQKLQQGLSHGQLAKLRELSENKNFSPNEINSSIEKFLGEVRTHIHHGVIKLDKFAPELSVPNEIEDILAKKGTTAPPNKTLDESNPSESAFALFSTPNTTESNAPLHFGSVSMSSSTTTLSAGHEEVTQLKKINQQMQQELQILRQENRAMKEKLEKIRKIA